MGIEGWRRKAQDRDQWRRIAQEAKAYVGLYRLVMMMMTVNKLENISTRTQDENFPPTELVIYFETQMIA
jgi:ABC-type antimicrobial peptide transport system permease subunit